ncbi:MAG TPA: hypothetical protein VG295_03635 [Solirubrobacteraceae bacterium]|nr:hypothetical protein [Solirubrobacteraceae bacterium]
MSAKREFPAQIRCLAIDSTRITVLDSGALLHNVIVEIAEEREHPTLCGDRDPTLVSLTPQQARELASSLWWLAGRSERIAQGVR